MSPVKKFCFALDLIDDPGLIKEYEQWHKAIWPEIKESILNSGITKMEIYRTGNRLLMIMETNEDFDLAAKAIADAQNPRVQEWEQLMWKFQQPLPFAAPGEKWVQMDRIFLLE